MSEDAPAYRVFGTAADGCSCAEPLDLAELALARVVSPLAAQVEVHLEQDADGERRARGRGRRLPVTGCPPEGHKNH